LARIGADWRRLSQKKKNMYKAMAEALSPVKSVNFFYNCNVDIVIDTTQITILALNMLANSFDNDVYLVRIQLATATSIFSSLMAEADTGQGCCGFG
jgi:hypothetical protein